MSMSLAVPERVLSCVYARDVRDDARALLLAALPATARRMEAHNQTIPADRLGETAHLRPAMEGALTAAAVAPGCRSR
jgi:hypothetical protein